jgi:hypothetical protein
MPSGESGKGEPEAQRACRVEKQEQRFARGRRSPRCAPGEVRHGPFAGDPVGQCGEQQHLDEDEVGVHHATERCPRGGARPVERQRVSRHGKSQSVAGDPAHDGEADAALSEQRVEATAAPWLRFRLVEEGHGWSPTHLVVQLCYYRNNSTTVL